MTKVKMWYEPRAGEPGSTLLGRFRRRASGKSWAKGEIDAVVWDAVAGDDDHLHEVLLRHVEPQRTDDLRGVRRRLRRRTNPSRRRRGR